MGSPVFQTLGELSGFMQTRATSLYVADPGLPLYDATQALNGIWSAQPSVRKVVDFIASQIASIPVNCYERVSDVDRQRVTAGPLADIAKKPQVNISRYRFWYLVMIDRLLNDRWAALKTPSGDTVTLTRIPPYLFRLKQDRLERIVAVTMWDENSIERDYDPKAFIYDAGYTDNLYRGAVPMVGTLSAGTSPIETIKHLLDEAAEAVAYRRGVWKNQARIPAVLKREKGWSSDEARNRFVASWKNFMRGGGQEGGTPILEDGMSLEKFDAFKPQDTGDLEGRKLTDIEVASIYHQAPELLGMRPGNYANMDAFRQMLYRDSLGPYITERDDALNVCTQDLLGGRNLYLESNVEAKLRGSFLEQAQVLQSAVGAPYMQRAEARAMLNLPFVEGSEDLVVPLNVLVGGQASPRDSGSQNLGPGKVGAGHGFKSRPPATYETRAREVLSRFFRRQGSAIKSRLGAKASEDWWDAERWDNELGAALLAVGTLVSETAAKSTLETLSIDPTTYDVDRTMAYLAAMSKNSAKRINNATHDELAAALEEDDWSAAVDDVVSRAENSRAELAAVGIVSDYAGFGTREAGRQCGAHSKTWITGENPRPEHAALDGETVDIDELFSNGSMWPGDGMDGEYGCNCSLEINVG